MKRKKNRANMKDLALLEKALENEKKRSSSLSMKLKKVRAEKAKLAESINVSHHENFMRAHSTSLEEQHDSLFTASRSNLSAATINIPECKPVANEEEIDKQSYERWKEILEASIQLVGATDEITKMNILKVKAGSKLLEILDNTPSTQNCPDPVLAPYSNALNRFSQYFGSRQYNLMQRQKLLSTVQIDGETDTKYLNRVIATAKLCGYDDDRVVDSVAEVIQTHAVNIKVREAGRKMLRKGGSLADLIVKVRGYDLDKANEEIFAKTHPKVLHSGIATLAYNNSRFRYSNSKLSNYSRGEPRYVGNWKNFRNQGTVYDRAHEKKSENITNQCWRCTSRYHLPSECHAIRKVCRNCQVVGHIERACRKMPLPSLLKRKDSSPDGRETKSKRIAVVEKDEKDLEETQPCEKQDTFSVNKYTGSKDQDGVIVGRIAGIFVPFLIDSGAEVNTIAESVFDLLMSYDLCREQLFCLAQGTDEPLKAYASPVLTELLRDTNYKLRTKLRREMYTRSAGCFWRCAAEKILWKEGKVETPLVLIY
ncbi:uncharacterized protein LOC131432691 isoform X2 [Malaya genurostris]|uniref:uncharacterized protein LOC131432691 isoform X2 n=1 Tax=Malaya genurostris TaxID=325434 RepID=UPI0026F3BD68|nr:uncharacterized protein LOC131432691 isoform X2 [Malaya genurostris]